MEWPANEKYFALLNDYGDDLGQLGFAALASQGARFATVFESGSLAGATVLDYGCGLADLYKVAIQLGQLPARYLGVELTAKSSQRARDRLAGFWGGTLPATVDCMDLPSFAALDSEFELVVCLSVLIVPEGDRQQTLDQWRKLMEQLWRKTSVGGRLIVDFRRMIANDPPHVVSLSVPEIIEFAECFTSTYLLDCSRADHLGTLVLSKAPTFTRKYWALRESLSR